jgi:hypothetical protein
MEILLPEFKHLLLLLNKHKVSYMLIGGYAVIYYGYERTTTDMDIWLQPTNTNKAKLIEALKEFGIGSASIKALSELDFAKTQFFFFGKKPRRIDFLTSINNVKFEEAIKEVNFFSVKKDKIPVIQYNHLILSKITNERAKDRADVEELQKIRGNKKDN